MSRSIVPAHTVVKCDLCEEVINTKYANFIEITSGLDGCSRNQLDLCDMCYGRFNTFLRTEKESHRR